MDDVSPKVRQSLASRMAELKANPESLRERFCSPGAAELTQEDWGAVEAMVTRQVVDDFDTSVDEQIIGDYRVLARLGAGSQGVTYLVRSLKTKKICALKQMHLDAAENWKAVELFERESKLLANLDHPSVPNFVEFFETEAEGLQLNLVQEFVAGTDLALRLKLGELFTGAQLTDILHQLLDVLEYLHGHSPAVVHRDIKPANVILTADNELVLVDFGAVQFQTGRGTTVVGTAGYMPPEQLMGHATAASDLFSTGATMIHLATRRHPADLPLDGLKLDWKRHASLDPHTRACLDALIEPDPSRRPRNVKDVRDLLANKGTALIRRDIQNEHWIRRVVHKVFVEAGGPSKVAVVRDDHSLDITIGRRSRLRKSALVIIPILLFGLFAVTIRMPPVFIVLLIIGGLMVRSFRRREVRRIQLDGHKYEALTTSGRKEIERHSFALLPDASVEVQSNGDANEVVLSMDSGRRREVVVPAGVLDDEETVELFDALAEFLDSL